MRLLHVHDQARFQGGVEQILFDTARGLAARGWPQALLSPDTEVHPEFGNAFEQVVHTRQRAAAFQPDAVLLHKVSDTNRVAKLARFYPTAHMVHDHDLVCARRHKYTPLDGRICNRPAGVSCYRNLCFVQKAPAGSALPIRFKGIGGVRKALAAGESVRKFLVGSAWMRAELEMNGIPARSIQILHPVPAAAAQPGALPTSGSRELLFVGQVIRGKGVDLMLEACARLQGDWSATIAGDGNHLPFCRERAAQLGISDRVNFAGWVNHGELERYYAQARAVIVPSRWPEPFGMVGVEAMARGRAVIGFDSGGIRDWLEDGITGRLVPSGDVAALAGAMQHLVDHREVADRLGQAGVKRVAKDFLHQAYLDGMQQHLEQLQ